MKLRLASPIQTDSIVDGEGIRTVIWTQGCSHHCKGCHNPETHSFTGGFEIEVEEVIHKFTMIKAQDGITFSGGDPFFQPKACCKIATYCKQNDLTVWCYTGFTFEQLLELSKTNTSIQEFLQQIDVLIDGKFEEDKKSLQLYFRGSSNQRIIDLPQSLILQKPIEIEKYKKRKQVTSYRDVSHTSKNIFI